MSSKALPVHKSSSSEVNEAFKLPPLEAAFLCVVLEITSDQITIIGSAENNPDIQMIALKVDSLKKRAEKYIKTDPIFNCLNGELFIYTLNKMKYTKLNSDRAYLEEILVKTRDEVHDSKTFDILLDTLGNLQYAKKEEDTLIKEQLYNKTYASTLKNTVKRKTESSQKEIGLINERISKYRDEMESFLFDNALKLRYVENWENARIEQGYMLCDQQEEELTNKINKYKNEIEKEIRINAEIESYIAENQKDMEDAIESWTHRYETELEEKQTQIQMYKEKRDEQQKRYKAMLVDFDKHAKEMQDWIEYREKKRERDELEEKQNKAATKIQAWWRGEMFRHQLGPYNPNPPEPKKKKEKKKKPKKGKKK